MKRALPLLLDTLYLLALAVWLGGLFAKETVFTSALSATPFPGLPVPVAASVDSALLSRFGLLAEFCGILLLILQFLLRRRYQRHRALFIGDGVRQLLTFAALFLSEYVLRGILPGLQAALNAGSKEDYTRLSRPLEFVSILQLALLVAITALTVWLHLPRVASAPAELASKPSRAPATRKAAK